MFDKMQLVVQALYGFWSLKRKIVKKMVLDTTTVNSTMII